MPEKTVSSRTRKDKALPRTYEDAVHELESLLNSIETGQLPLEQLLTSYKRGAELLAFCRQRLEDVEEQVQLLDEQYNVNRQAS